MTANSSTSGGKTSGASVQIFKALSDKTRLQILIELSHSGELSCSDLGSKFDLSQPAFSHHCSKLAQAGLVTMRKDGTLHLLSVNKSFLIQNGIDLAKLS